MFIAIPMLAIMAAVAYFTVVGIKATIDKRQDGTGLVLIRDLIKYLALLISVIITSLGLAGLLTLLIDQTNYSYGDKLSAARWLSFVFVGVPIIAILARWIRNDFAKDPGAKYEPAWQIYLLASTSISLLFWFIPLAGALKWLAGGFYQPRALSQSIIAFIIWLIHLKLISIHKNPIINIHRFIGWFVGFVGSAVALISMIDFGISKATQLQTGYLQFQESLILLAISLPLAIYYWQDFERYAFPLEARIYRTFAGMALPLLFITIAATFAIHQFLSWNFDTRYQSREIFFADVPSQIGTLLVLIPLILFFRNLVKYYERDNITRTFQYLLSAGGTLGIAIGVGAIVKGALDNTDKDAVLFGVSILITTVPTWLNNWRQCQFALAIDFEGEHHAPVRRFYLYAVVGVPTLISIGSAVWFSYILFKALFIGGLDRIAISTPSGFLIGGGLVALYHANVLRRERD